MTEGEQANTSQKRASTKPRTVMRVREPEDSLKPATSGTSRGQEDVPKSARSRRTGGQKDVLKPESCISKSMVPTVPGVCSRQFRGRGRIKDDFRPEVKRGNEIQSASFGRVLEEVTNTPTSKAPVTNTVQFDIVTPKCERKVFPSGIPDDKPETESIPIDLTDRAVSQDFTVEGIKVQRCCTQKRRAGSRAAQRRQRAKDQKLSTRGLDCPVCGQELLPPSEGPSQCRCLPPRPPQPHDSPSLVVVQSVPALQSLRSSLKMYRENSTTAYNAI
ncbi:uncharacterized protein LOC109614812 [Esox lucius]|uniref:uncharacterized protein LOC109614812 n=1 Tax=Esox lucius TaxID=8010 RepID=UPI00147698AD|nr:uncharacterized protein LOC109614812 [Esox lucius]